MSKSYWLTKDNEKIFIRETESNCLEYEVKPSGFKKWTKINKIDFSTLLKEITELTRDEFVNKYNVKPHRGVKPEPTESAKIKELLSFDNKVWYCTECDIPMKLIKFAKNSTTKRWACQKCSYLWIEKTQNYKINE